METLVGADVWGTKGDEAEFAEATDAFEAEADVNRTGVGGSLAILSFGT